MVSQQMLDELNRQINRELFAAYYYLAICAYCESQEMTGAAGFFRVQAKEELEHAMKIFDYVVKRRNGEVDLQAIKECSTQFKSLREAFEAALKNEQDTTKGIYQVMDLAHKERDYATITLLNWFAEEQAEEESLMEHYVNRLRMVGEDGSGLLLIDNELGSRRTDSSES